MSKTAIVEIDGKRCEFPVEEEAKTKKPSILTNYGLTGIILTQGIKIQVLVPVNYLLGRTRDFICVTEDIQLKI
jgi:hypothetical protein